MLFAVSDTLACEKLGIENRDDGSFDKPSISGRYILLQLDL